jgi:ABC-type cobalamin/Fe3+-siderophores transport system ATPase subunit
MHERMLLRDVSLQLDAGELVAVWGLRRSGRSTLLRIAAGVEPPDTGVVRFAGRDLGRAGGDLLGSGIAYCQHAAAGPEAHGVLDEMIAAQLARGVTQASARMRAWAALARAGADECADYEMHELDCAEQVRVTLARGLLSRPSLIVIDEPIDGVDLLARDEILALLRSLADEGIAVLMSTGDAAAFTVADRALSLSDGELRGAVSPELAPVVPLRRRASA